MQDIYAYGVVSASTLYRLQHDFPAAEGYAEVESVHSMVGGEAANSSIVLARLGASVKLDGCIVGDDEAGARVRRILAAYDIDLSGLPPQQGAQTVQELVIAAGGTRTIFGTYVRLHRERAWHPPDADAIRQARVLCLDPFFGEASLAAADAASAAAVPIVTIDCAFDDPVARRADVLVVAESFIRETYGESGLDELFDAYRRSCEGLVIFTFGDRALWYAGPGERRASFEPFAIEPVDTAGGGDAFRAGVVFGVLQGWSPPQTIEFAAAVAAIVCTRSPGVLDAPTRDEVEAFIRARRSR